VRPGDFIPFASSPDPVWEYEPQYTSRDEAIQDLKASLDKISEKYPSLREKENLHWNRAWLDKAIIVFKDPRTHLRMKLLANCYYDAESIEDVLNMAWRFGFKFHLFVSVEDVESFSNANISSLDSLVFSKIYRTDFTERFMTWGVGGESQYVLWLSSAKGVVDRPNAVAFIAEGGILSYIAQVLDPDLIYRFVQGPSIQVTEFSGGETFKQKNRPGGGERVSYTTDRVSEGEKLILLGYISGGSPEKDLTLFPPPSVLEDVSLHSHGMIGNGVNKIIMNIFKDIDSGIYKWQTVRGWKKYLRRNNTGEHAPEYIPRKEDFDEVGRKMRRAFPISWQQLPIREIQVPEAFDTRAHRD
jgi:hypothetical protein